MRKKVLIIFSILITISCIYCGKSPGSVEGRVGGENSTSGQFKTFSFQQKDNPALIENFTGSVNNTAKTIVITIEQPKIIDMLNLKASFTFEGSYVMIGKEVQQSTITPNSFLKPVTYRVFAEDNSYADYKVTVYFAITYPYKPEIYGAGIRGSLVEKETLFLDYTYRDRNRDKQKASKIEWQVETEPYNENYVTMITQYVSDPDVISTDGSEILQENITFVLPEHRKGCRVRVFLTPKSAPDPDKPDQTTDILTGYTITYNINTIIKTGYAAGLVIDELSAGGVMIPANGSYKYREDEYIVLYNPTSWSIDLTDLEISYYSESEGDWIPYFTFTDPDQNTRILKPDSVQINKILPSKQYFIIARESTDKSVKKKSDMVLILDSTVDIPEDRGAVRITHDGEVIDMLGYGGEFTTNYEGPAGNWPKAPGEGEKIVRYNHNDIDNNSRDMIYCQSTNLVSNWRNVFTDAPIIIITGITYNPGTAEEPGPYDYTVEYQYFDWQYNNEGDTECKWEILTKTGDDYLPYNPAVNWTHPVDGKSFIITDEDYDQLPAGMAPYLRVTLTPKSEGGLTGSPVMSYYIGDNPSGIYHPLAPVRPAKLLISRILPSQNIIELYAAKGGSLNKIRVGCTMASFDTNPDQDLPVPRIWKLEDRMIYSGSYIRIQTKKTLNTDWDSIPSMVAFLAHPLNPPDIQYPLIDTAHFAAYKGIVFEILSVTSAEGAEEETYHTDDTLVIGMNKPSEKAPAIKRYLVLQNKNRLTIEKKIEWKTSFDSIDDFEDINKIEALRDLYPDPLNFAYISDVLLTAAPADSFICSTMVNALNDYVIVTDSNPDSYIMYRSGSDSDIAGDFTFNHIAPTEFFLDTGFIGNNMESSFTIEDPEMIPDSDSNPPSLINTSGTVPVTSVSLPFVPVLLTSAVKRITPSVNPSDGYVNDVEWTSSNTSAAVFIDDSRGLLTAVGAGTTTVTITLTTTGGVTRTSTRLITVVDPPLTKTMDLCLNFSGNKLELKEDGDQDGTIPLVELTYNSLGITSYIPLFTRYSVGLYIFPQNKLIERISLTDHNGKEDFNVTDNPDPDDIVSGRPNPVN